MIIRSGLWFSSFCFREIPRNCQNLINFSCRSFKSRKSKGYQGGFLAICNFVFSSSISNLVLLIFFPSTGNRKDTNMFNVSAKLRKFHRRKLDNLIRKIPNFFVAKHLAIEKNYAKIGMWACVNFRIADHKCSFHFICSVRTFEIINRRPKWSWLWLLRAR